MFDSDRLAALKATYLLDSGSEERFDRLTRLASRALGTEIAIISLIDSDRQWFKSKVGLELDETEREVSFCDHAILNNDVMVVPDARKDPRFVQNPLVTGGPAIRFYAGAPLITTDGFALGTLCVIDSSPRFDFSPDDKQILEDLAASVMTEIEMVEKSQMVSDLTVVNEELRHRMGNMYAHVSALISMVGKSEVDKDKFVRRLREKITTLGQTQSLLAAHKWASIPMSELVETTLAPFLTSSNRHRVKIDFTDNFHVSPRGAFILTLMLSELGTNAVKHGVLGPRDGELTLGWKTGEVITLNWAEKLKSDLPNPSSTEKVDPGFGSQILKRIVPMDLLGEADYALSPKGLIYQVSARPDRICVSQSVN